MLPSPRQVEGEPIRSRAGPGERRFPVHGRGAEHGPGQRHGHRRRPVAETVGRKLSVKLNQIPANPAFVSATEQHRLDRRRATLGGVAQAVQEVRRGENGRGRRVA